jgi:hypothetical protein
MKYLQNIIVSSDGSIVFIQKTFKNDNLINFHAQDDKNFNFYQKVKVFSSDSKHLKTYKKKYFK